MSLKPRWRMLRFGDFVENVREQVKPVPEDSECYIGLEHLDPSSLHVKRWGTEIDMKGQKLRMRKGDLLFARRNAYLRRVAIAPHDGLFSAHGMVMRPKPEKILPEFLPFFLQSDIFMERAIEISVGSLSPTINWKTLRVQEFPLPPIEEQKRIAELLWAADTVYEQHRESFDNLMLVKRALLTRLTTRGVRESNTQHTKLGDIADGWQVATVDEVTSLCQYGLSLPLHESGRYPVLRMMNYDDGHITANDLKYVDLNDKDSSAFRLRKGDILFNPGLTQ